MLYISWGFKKKRRGITQKVGTVMERTNAKETLMQFENLLIHS
jgi:hypothetical protein